MTLFILDIGNKQVKMESEKALKIYPSYFVDVTQYGNRDVLGFAKDLKERSDYQSSRDEGFTYVWGKELDIDAVDAITDTIGFGAPRYKSRDFRLLVDFALAELARDYEEAETGILTVNVSTGIPTDDYLNHEAVEAFVKAIKGDHNVTVNGRTLNIRVKTLFVQPQPLGTIINEVTDEIGLPKRTPLTQADVGIADLGGGTILIDALRKMNLVENKRAQLNQGAYTLYDAVQKALTKDGYTINAYEVEQVIREGNDAEVYVWSPDAVQRIGITKYVMLQRKLFTRNVARAIKTAFKGFGRMQALLVTGGAANLLIKEEFTKELPIAYFVENSELANLNGFRKYAIAAGAGAK